MPIFDFTNGYLPPGVTFNRASQGNYFGLLNLVRNPTMAGAVVGNPGTNPTNWVMPNNSNGLNKSIVEVGIENNIPYIDVRWQGTPAATSNIYIYNEAATIIPALVGQTVMVGSFLKLINAGTGLRGMNAINIQYAERNAAGTALITRINVLDNIVDSIDSNLRRYEYISQISDANCVWIQTGIRFNTTIGVDVDITLRIGNPVTGNNTSLITVEQDFARFERDHTSLAVKGIYNESTFTNAVRNSVAGGAVAGSPGTDPTNWTMTASINGLTRTILGTGVEDGIPYIDVRYNGTAVAASTLNISPEGSTSGALATIGQPAFVSSYASLRGGSTTGFTSNGIYQYLTERNVAGTALYSMQTYFNLINAPLKTRLINSTRTLNFATVARVTTNLIFTYSAGAVIDLTIRAGFQQIGVFLGLSSPVFTSTVAVTRAAEILRIPLANGTYKIDIVTPYGTTTLPNQQITTNVYTVPNVQGPISQIVATKTLGIYYDFSTGIPPVNLPTSVARASTAWNFSAPNYLKNPNMLDIVPGAVLNGGSLPSNWAQSGTVGGGGTTVLGYGYEDGIPYIDIQWQGNNIATSYSLNFELAGSIPATYGQIWNFYLYAKLLAGSFAGLPTARLSVRSQSTGHVYGDSLLGITSLGFQKFSVSAAPTDAGITSVVPTLFFSTTNGAAVDLTLRIGMPWLSPGVVPFITNPVNTTRFQADQFTGNFDGLLAEPATTHYLVNSAFSGGNPGVSNPPGMTGTGAHNGTALTFIGSGTEDGIPYAEWRFYSPTVPSATSLYGLQFVVTPAAQGQVWTGSEYVRISGGSMTGVSLFQWAVQERAGGTIVASDTMTIVPTTAPLRTQYFNKSRTLTGGTTDSIRITIFLISYTINVAIDVTFRVGMPHLMQTDKLPSPILTTGTAFTRSVENLTLPVLNGTYDVDVLTTAGLQSYNNQVVSTGTYAVPATQDSIRTVTITETGSFDFTSGALPTKTTVARAGIGWTFNSAAVLTTYAVNIPRYRYDTTSLLCDGLLNEDTSTNYVRNSVATGSVPGSGGAAILPTNWQINGGGSNLVHQVIGSGIEDGINYVEIRLSGTPSATAALVWTPELLTQILANNGEDWVGSFFIKIVAGSITNFVSSRLSISGRDSAGIAVSGQNTASFFTPTNAPLKTQRQQVTWKFTNANVVCLSSDFRLDFEIAKPVDITFRLGNPVWEKANNASSPIVTTGLAITRPRDILTIAVQNSTYRITIIRVDGTTVIPSQVVSNNSYIVPNSNSPVISVSFETLAVSTASGQSAVTGRMTQGLAVQSLASGVGEANSTTGMTVSSRGLSSADSFADGLTPSVQTPTTLQGVKYWQGFPGPAGYIDIPQASYFPVDNVYHPLNLRDTRGFAYLLRAFLPNKASGTESLTTVYLAASMGRSTAPDDTPSNTYVPGLLLNSTINYQVSLFSGIEPVAESRGGQGAIVLIDPKGTIDSLVNESWDGARLDILQGPPFAKFNTYSLVDKLTTAGLLYSQRKKEIRLRDQAWKLQQANLHDNIYAGTGLAEGPVELKGTYKPYGVGVVKNVTPQLINAPFQIYQVCCTSVQAINAVRDGGIDLAFSGINYSNYAALAAAANAGQIPAGKHSTCLGQGLFALGAKPVFGVTVDFQGDNEVINATGYGDSLAKICRRIATGRGNVKLTDADLDFVALNKLDQIQPDACGWFWKDQTTKADALTLIMNSRLGWWATLMNGLTAFGIMDNPSGDPSLIINYPNDFSGEPEQLETYQVPRSQTYVGYSFNYTKQDPSALAGSLDAATIAIYNQDSFWANQASAVPLWKQPTAQVFRVQSGFTNLTAAQAEATRQQSIMGVRRERWTIPVPCAPFSDVLGKIVRVDNFPRYGWPASKNFICIGVSFASGIAVKLTLWG